VLQGTPTPDLPPLPQIPYHTDPMQVAIAIMVVVAASGLVGSVLMLVKAWVRRIANVGGADAVTPEVMELRDTVQHMAGQLAEVEERLDFAERLLARERDAERVRGPKA
jgi:cytochrome c biogenesis protein ResB